jgi:hypothetical protein
MSKMLLLSQNSPLAAEICIEEEEKRAQLVQGHQIRRDPLRHARI